jgi:hypothetical protein
MRTSENSVMAKLQKLAKIQSAFRPFIGSSMPRLSKVFGEALAS